MYETVYVFKDSHCSDGKYYTNVLSQTLSEKCLIFLTDYTDDKCWTQ